MHQKRRFELKKSTKKFWGGVQLPLQVGRGTPSPHAPSPRRLRRLDPHAVDSTRAFGA